MKQILLCSFLIAVWAIQSHCRVLDNPNSDISQSDSSLLSKLKNKSNHLIEKVYYKGDRAVKSIERGYQKTKCRLHQTASVAIDGDSYNHEPCRNGHFLVAVWAIQAHCRPWEPAFWTTIKNTAGEIIDDVKNRAEEAVETIKHGYNEIKYRVQGIASVAVKGYYDEHDPCFVQQNHAGENHGGHQIGQQIVKNLVLNIITAQAQAHQSKVVHEIHRYSNNEKTLSSITNKLENFSAENPAKLKSIINPRSNSPEGYVPDRRGVCREI
ncbi:unnamed protein product [Phyllotreta striolata]|uniref:Uncharacterized protein n=1 Tax=Phyllotreta striolata TaxID=444603 RepID=A0A9N9TA73_PHYSR|nr:unnamed protein product [Phyllotreta striolata]